MKAGDIPGWEKIDNTQLENCPGAQIVNGQWYMPKFACDSLQEVVDMVIELHLHAYHADTWADYRGSGVRGSHVSSGVDAIAFLKEWGMLDGEGQLIPEVTNE